MIVAHHEIVMVVEWIGVSSVAGASLSIAFLRRLRRVSRRRDGRPPSPRR
jgi:hypothetical protein